MVTASKRLMQGLSPGDPSRRLDVAKTRAGRLEQRQGNHPVESLNRCYLPFLGCHIAEHFRKKKPPFWSGQSQNLLQPFQPLRFCRGPRPIVEERIQVAGCVHLADDLEQGAVRVQDVDVRLGLLDVGDRDAAEDSLLPLEIDLEAGACMT